MVRYLKHVGSRLGECGRKLTILFHYEKTILNYLGFLSSIDSGSHHLASLLQRPGLTNQCSAVGQLSQTSLTHSCFVH